MAINTVKIMPWSDDAQSHLLRQLQGTPHFETRASKACTTLPSRFVEQHGDKLLLSVILRTESSPTAWPVKLVTFADAANGIDVRFGAGWTQFATSNSLLEGDSLLFGLTAVSEFEVFIFRTIDEPLPLGAEDDGWQEAEDMSFQKKLTENNIQKYGGAFLEIPRWFWSANGSRMHYVVKLQGIHDQSPVRTMVCHSSKGKMMRHFLRSGWREFVAENHLHVGQELLFTLSSDLVVVVRDVHAPK